MNKENIMKFIEWLYDNDHSIQPFDQPYADISHEDIEVLVDAYIKEIEQ